MTMRRTLLTLSAVAGTALALAAAPAAGERVNVTLTGFEEVPVNTSAASGSLRLFINDREGTIDYELTFEGLQGNVTQAHIHVAQAGVNGGIVLWLCGTGTNPGPAGTPACPSPGGTVTGTLTSNNVTPVPGQLIGAGELDEIIRAIRAGKAYGNVHSSLAPGGEIRGQLH